MEINISKVRELVNQILSDLETAKPSVKLPKDWFWEIESPTRYLGTEPPDDSKIGKRLLKNDWRAVEKATETAPPGLELLVQLSNLLRVMGDCWPEVLGKDNDENPAGGGR